MQSEGHEQNVGAEEGARLGLLEGAVVGDAVGFAVGEAVGAFEGAADGAIVGLADGSSVGQTQVHPVVLASSKKRWPAPPEHVTAWATM